LEDLFLDYAEIHFLPGWFCADKECVVSVVLDTRFNAKAFHLVAIGSASESAILD
jgi:hypothetical protein